MSDLTNEQIHEHARSEWLAVLSRLWIAIGREVDKRQLLVYEQALGMLPLGLLELAVNEVLYQHRYTSVPTIADVAEMARRIAGVASLHQAGEAWLCQRRPFAWRF
ncbi:hypothetical protein [Bellilinea sp.]|uniref:hypothetical protein n=1 Tax=Bellilinea sp. TaxID=2838785 RepID=UPI002ADE4FBD|nr:hypothetical protein [Bellilinea sp.]